MPNNRAAWLLAPRQRPLVINEAPFYKPKAGEVLIKNHAIAVNPIDWKNQQNGLYQNIYPFILGRNCAGKVEEVGEGVTRFSKGQRVMAHMHSPQTGSYANSAFQLYSVASERLMARIPDTVSYEEASVLPLSVSTAAAGLYLPEYLGLPCPAPGPRTLRRTILIWGGASSVGATAIQLAAASGLRIVTTASTPNHDFVRSLGASVVFDYRSDSLVEDLVKELDRCELVGVFDAIAEEQSFIPIKTTIEHLHQTVRVVSVLPYDHPTEKFNPRFISSYGIAYPPNQGIGELIWGGFVTEGLASGQLQAKPDPVIVGSGLEQLQKALDLQKAGVSAKKLIITL